MAPKLAHKRSLFVSRPRRTIGAAGRLHGKGRCGMASPGARVAGAADGGDGGLPSWVARHGDGGVVRGGAHAPAPPRRLGVPEARQPQARPGGGQAEEAPVHAPRAAALRDLRDPDAGVAAAAAEVVPGVPARRRLEGGRLRGRSRARPGDERGHRALRGARAPRRDVGRIGAPSAGSRARSRPATSSWAPPPRGRWAVEVKIDFTRLDSEPPPSAPTYIRQSRHRGAPESATTAGEALSCGARPLVL